MSVECYGAIVVVGLVAFYVGSQVSRARGRAEATVSARITAYRDLLAKLSTAGSALSEASIEEAAAVEPISDECKKAVWSALNALSHQVSQTAFLLPQSVLDVLDEADFRMLGNTWLERAEKLGEVRRRVHDVAQKDVGVLAPAR